MGPTETGQRQGCANWSKSQYDLAAQCVQKMGGTKAPRWGSRKGIDHWAAIGLDMGEGHHKTRRIVKKVGACREGAGGAGGDASSDED